MSQHMNMNAMGGGVGPSNGQQMMNTGTPGGMASGMDGNRVKLHTYIYDYFLKNEYYDLARSVHERLDLETLSQTKQSPNTKQVNGDSMDADNKDDAHGKPADLPLAAIAPGVSEGSFLFDWWCQFWDCFNAQRSRGPAASKQYLNHVQQQARMQNERQRMMVNPQMQGNMQLRNAMMQNGMGMPNDMKKAAMQGTRTPQQIQQMQQYRMAQQHQLMQQQTQMQRDGSSMDINGQQRPQTPGSGENAPSPKRQRLDGGINGQMGPMGRGQPQGMQAQQVGPSDPVELVMKLASQGINPDSLSASQFNALQMQTPGVQNKSMQVYAHSMRQQMQTAIDSNAQKGMPNPAGMPQGSPAIDSSGEFFNASQMRGLPGAGPGGPNNNSNHALQDYQMQLMLLEQQNKKRLLMARQEQDSVSNGPQPGQPGFGAPAMSPQGSRAGPSPNPDEQMKRGTPKMAPGGMPLPNPDGSMPQNRGSPIPGYDPNQMNPNMAPGMYPQMQKMGGIMGPNGQMMPATSHPAFNGMNGQMNGMTPQQQMEFMQRTGARPQNMAFPQGPPPNMMPGGPPQQPPNMTPRQGNAAMPPPPAPTTGEQNRTQPSSPQQPAAPPTPSQSNKPNPKKGKDNKGNKKAPAKKGGANTAATPASEAEQPPTPTPAPPITPTAPNQPFNKGNGQPGVQPIPAQSMPSQPDMNMPFGALEGNDAFGMNLDFSSLEGQDVLDNFDFDSFLNNDAGENAFAFDANMAFGTDGLEAGGDV